MIPPLSFCRWLCPYSTVTIPCAGRLHLGGISHVTSSSSEPTTTRSSIRSADVRLLSAFGQHRRVDGVLRDVHVVFQSKDRSNRRTLVRLHIERITVQCFQSFPLAQTYNFSRLRNVILVSAVALLLLLLVRRSRGATAAGGRFTMS